MASHLHIMVLSRDFPLLFGCGNLLGEKAVGCDNNIISRKPELKESSNQEQESIRTFFARETTCMLKNAFKNNTVLHELKL